MSVHSEVALGSSRPLGLLSALNCARGKNILAATTLEIFSAYWPILLSQNYHFILLRTSHFMVSKYYCRTINTYYISYRYRYRFPERRLFFFSHTLTLYSPFRTAEGAKMPETELFTAFPPEKRRGLYVETWLRFFSFLDTTYD